MSSELTHLDARGQARMVDVSDKDSTRRIATAEAEVYMRAETLALIVAGGFEKGDVLAVARIAGIQGAKRTADLIPLCHPLALSSVQVECEPDAARSCVRITATCKLAGRTGVEMEALTAVSVAALTLYDMCKAVDRGMRIDNMRLLEKSGGRSGHWLNETAGRNGGERRHNTARGARATGAETGTAESSEKASGERRSDSGDSGKGNDKRSGK